MAKKIRKKRKFSYFRFIMFFLFIFAFLSIARLGLSNSNGDISYDTPTIIKNQSAAIIIPSVSERLDRFMLLEDNVRQKRSEIDNYITIDQIPEALQQAVIAVEDNRFYEHAGFDISSIVRATLVNLQYGEIKEGASTITQQLIKNMFLSQEQTIGRKFEEILLAARLEKYFTKSEILEMYLNSIYFGSGYYGIGEAATGYFGKKPAELNLAEATMLAGIPNAPSLYSPYVDFILAKKRQLIVVEAMVKNGYLKAKVAEDTKIKPLYLAH